MEVAGVVLGAIPVIIYALERYQDTRETVQSFRLWKETLGTLRSNIFLQKRQLFATLSTLDINLTDHTTMADVEAALRISHPAQCDDVMRILKQMDNLMNEVAENLYPDFQGPVRLLLLSVLASNICAPIPAKIQDEPRPTLAQSC